MEALTCKCCGAPLEADGRCSYCGTRHKIDYISPQLRTLEVVSVPAKTQEISAFVAVPMEDIHRCEAMDAVEFGKYVRHRLAGQMTRFIEENMQVRMFEDHMTNAMRCEARLRVVWPEQKTVRFNG